MNWLTNFVKPKLSSLVKRRDVPEKLWNNCVSCGSMIHHKDLKENLFVCINCNYHFRMSAENRIKLFFKEGDLSGVGYLKLPKGMTNNKMVKNKKIKTNGTIDFINGQKGFLSKSIYNVVPKINELIIFPNYLMHTAYPFNINGERRSFSFNAKITLKK